MVWPYLWGLCASLTAVCIIARLDRAWRALACIMAAYVAYHALSYPFGAHDLYLSAGALIWVIAAHAVFRLGHTTPSGIVVLSALCYFWAASSNAPQVFGSIPFVVSDLLMVSAMVWIGFSGIRAFIGRVFNVVSGCIGDSRLSCPDDISTVSQAARWEKR